MLKEEEKAWSLDSLNSRFLDQLQNLILCMDRGECIIYYEPPDNMIEIESQIRGGLCVRVTYNADGTALLVYTDSDEELADKPGTWRSVSELFLSLVAHDGCTFTHKHDRVQELKTVAATL